MATTEIDLKYRDKVLKSDAPLVSCPPEYVLPWPDLNPRRRFVQEELDELAASIEENGLIEPVLLTPAPEEALPVIYYVVAGEKRWRACRQADVPIEGIVRAIPFEAALKFAGLENIQRSGLTAIEEALWMQRMLDEGGYKQADVAEMLKREPSTVSNHLRLLELPEDVQALIEDGKLAPTNARDFLLPWMKEEEKVRDRFFKIVIQQLEFGAQMGQAMSKPWVKEMVERVGKIAKPEVPTAPKREPRPEAKKAKPAPQRKPAHAEGAKAPEAEEPSAEAPVADEPTETRAAEAAETATAGPGDQEPEPAQPDGEAETAPAATTVATSLDNGIFGSLAGAIGDRVHHVTLAIFPHPDGGGRFHVTLLPKDAKGVGAATGEVANGTAEDLDDQVRAAALRFLKKMNELAA